MKAVKPVGSAEVSPPDAADFIPAILCTDGSLRKKRMVINHAANHFGRVDIAVSVERNAIVFFYGKRLQAIHVIRQRNSSPVAQLVVPRRSRAGSHWQ